MSENMAYPIDVNPGDEVRLAPLCVGTVTSKSVGMSGAVTLWFNGVAVQFEPDAEPIEVLSRG